MSFGREGVASDGYHGGCCAEEKKVGKQLTKCWKVPSVVSTA